MDNGRLSVRSRDSANPRDGWYAERVDGRNVRLDEGTRAHSRGKRRRLMEAKKVRSGRGLEIRFIPVWGWTCRQQSAYSTLSPRFSLFFSLLFFPFSTVEFPIPSGGRVETWEWKLAGDADTVRKFHEGDHWQWRFSKGDDLASFVDTRISPIVCVNFQPGRFSDYFVSSFYRGSLLSWLFETKSLRKRIII